MKDYSFRLCRAGRRRRGDAGRARRRVDQDARFAGACGYFVYFPATTWSKLCCYWFQGTVLEGAPYVVSAQRPRGRPVIERCRWGWGQKSEDSPYLRGSGRLGMLNNLKTTRVSWCGWDRKQPAWESSEQWQGVPPSRYPLPYMYRNHELRIFSSRQ